MKLSVINYVTFQIGWFACVLSAANGRPLLGLVVALLILGLHLSLAPRMWAEVKLILACAAIGSAFDSLLLATGWVSYPNGEWIPGLAPYWIVAMWFLFAATLNLSMAWLKGRVVLAAFLGALGGPLSYIGGQNLDAIRLENPEAALLAVALGWTFMMPALCLLAERWNGFPRERAGQVILTDWDSERVKGRA
jgi:hypothetical protein